MAMPQAADELAGQDVLAAQPRRMAGGGMVAFAKGGDIQFDDRGTVRFQDQGRVPTWDEVEAARQMWKKNQLPWYMPTPASGDPSNLYLNEYKRLSDAFSSKTPLSNIDPMVTQFAKQDLAVDDWVVPIRSEGAHVVAS